MMRVAAAAVAAMVAAAAAAVALLRRVTLDRPATKGNHSATIRAGEPCTCRVALSQRRSDAAGGSCNHPAPSEGESGQQTGQK